MCYKTPKISYRIIWNWMCLRVERSGRTETLKKVRFLSQLHKNKWRYFSNIVFSCVYIIILKTRFVYIQKKWAVPINVSSLIRTFQPYNRLKACSRCSSATLSRNNGTCQVIGTLGQSISTYTRCASGLFPALSTQT